jgi:alpha-beta hydrolase superfamily lysophospholipase
LPNSTASSFRPSGFSRFGVASLALALALGACAPDFKTAPNALGTPKVAVTLKPDAVVTDDGTSLPMRYWPATGPGNAPAPVEAVIVAVHGFNDYSTCFEMPAEVWSRHGIATFAYDQRGFGAGPDPGRWAGGAALRHDLATILPVVRARFPDVPVYVLGESMGGAVVLDAVAGPEKFKPDGVILVAPAVWARSTMPLLNRVALWATSRLIPAETFTGEGLGVLPSDNYPMLRRLGRDPLFIKATRVDAIYGLVDLMDAALAAAPRDRVPTLLLYGAHDEIVPKDPVRDFWTALPDVGEGSQRLAYYQGGWHMLLRDLEGPVVAEDIVSWIKDHRAPLPSGADLAAGALLKGDDPTVVTATASR